MDRARLKAVLAGGSSIIFDARPRARAEKSEGRGEGFFASPLLRNVILLKLVEPSAEADEPGGLKTLLYFPYNPLQIGEGGASIVFERKALRAALERNLGATNFDGADFDADLAKLDVFARVPSLSPFLLRDAFERARAEVKREFFAIGDAEAEAVRERLKAKLKPLAAMALDLAPELIGGGQLDLLMRKLWQLDDAGFLAPLARALQIPEDDAVEVIYAWIGVSYFQSEFVAREARLKVFAEWLAKKSMPAECVPSAVLQKYQASRQAVRDALRKTWGAACDVFARYDVSYSSLISSTRDPKPFVAFLRTVRADFDALGQGVSTVDQCLSVFDFWSERSDPQRVPFDSLRQIMASLREISSDADTAARPRGAALLLRWRSSPRPSAGVRAGISGACAP